MEFPEEIVITLKKVGNPRYGENPQQDAAIYEIEEASGISLEKIFPITRAEQLNGKPMSFNNWLDADGVLKMLWQFEEPAATVFKHVIPSGAAQAGNIFDAYKKAWNSDPLSAFGGVAGVNRKVDKELANYIVDKKFLEVLIAPDYDDDALETLCKKKNLRILKTNTEMPDCIGYDIRAITGGFLIQEFDFSNLTQNDLIYLDDKEIKKPTYEQIEDMLFGWKIARRTRSNTVLLVKNKATIGIGAGQQSRVDAAYIACRRANQHHGGAEGSVAVSDAFFPFPDSIDVLHENRVSAVLSPAGSIRDEEVYETLRKYQMSAAHTPYVEKGGYKGGMRAFIH